MQCSPRTLLLIGATLWFAVGAWLLRKGIMLLASTPHGETVVLYLAAGLLIGLLKGRFVLGRVARRNSQRLQTLGSAPFWRFFALRDYLVILLMMGLGFLMRALDLPPAVRGPLLIAVGAALINGAVVAFRLGDRVSPA